MRLTSRTTLAAAGLAMLLPLAGAHAQPRQQGRDMPKLSAADLRVALNGLFAEHVTLAAQATGAALGGRQQEFQAAAAALDGNSNDIAGAIGMVYGDDAGAAFGPLWKKHIGFVVDYTVGLATKDRAKQDQAVQALLGYTRDLGAFLSGANPHLPTDAVAGLVKTHILSLKDVIDAQAAGDQQKAYAALRAANAHMKMIADPIAAAIAKQFPKRFASAGGTASAHAASTATVDVQLFQYRPKRLEVARGTRVVWVNRDDAAHTVTMHHAGAAAPHVVALDAKGDLGEETFTTAGTYAYACDRHPHMKGEIVVK